MLRNDKGKFPESSEHRNGSWKSSQDEIIPMCNTGPDTGDMKVDKETQDSGEARLSFSNDWEKVVSRGGAGASSWLRVSWQV